MNQKQIKKELKSLFRSMDFVSNNFLNGKSINKKEFQIYFNIYQQLGLVWEFLCLHCIHHEGYKKTRDKKVVCKVCGKVKDVDESYYLLPKEGIKKLGKRLKPDSRKTFKNKKKQKLLTIPLIFTGL